MALKGEDFIVAILDVNEVPKRVKGWVGGVEKNLRHLLRQIGDSTTKRMRRNVSAPQPYGGALAATNTVRRQGRIYNTIGYRVVRDTPGPYMIVGAIKGSDFGRQLALTHDQGAEIRAKRGWWHNGQLHKYLIYPPQGSPARDPSTGEQIMNANQTAKKFFSQWDVGNLIMVKQTQTSTPEVAFVKAHYVKIPARRIISREFDHVARELDRKVPTSIKTGLRLETLRF